MTRRRICISLVAMGLIVLVGCDRVTRENYAKIESGMSMDQVVEVLGEPTDLKSVGIGPLRASTARWEGKHGTISIQFTGEKVRIKRFLVGEEEEPGVGPD